MTNYYTKSGKAGIHFFKLWIGQMYNSQII